MKNIRILCLFFKQSWKSVFRFKLQFFTIVILAFLSVFIFTSSLTIKDRLNITYNQVVKNVDKFDYQSTDSFNFFQTEGQTINKKDLMLNFVPFESDSNFNGDKVVNVNFNSVYGETYLTKAFEDKRMFQLFKHNPKVNTVSFFNLSRLVIMEYLYSDLNDYFFGNKEEKEDVKYLERIPIFHYVLYLNDKSFIEKDLNNIRSILNEINFDSESEVSNNNNQKHDIDKIINRDLYIYTSNSIATIISFLQKVSDLVKNNDIKNRGIIFYQFITGYEIEDEANNKEWIVTSDNRLNNSAFIGQINDKNNYVIKKDEDYLQFLKKEGFKGKSTPIFVNVDQDNNISDVVNKKICLNSFSMTGDVNGDDWSNKFSSFNKSYVTNEIFYFLFNSKNSEWLTFNSDYYYLYDINEDMTTNLSFVYRMHLTVSAAFANMDIEFRKEVTIFDNPNQIQYSVVFLEQQQKIKLKLLNENQGGRMPQNRGEIVVSQQFAKAHDLKVSSQIFLGPQVFTVVGVVVDTMSYYPIVDKNLPIPQYKNTGIVWGTEETLFPIIKNSGTSSEEKLSTSEQHIFLWNKNDQKRADINKFKYLNNRTSEIVDFNNSHFRYNWTVQPMIVKIYMFSTISIVIVTALISLLGIAIYIKKLIKNNVKQIAILKAMGNSSLSIASSYSTLGCVILFFVIPIAWVFGLLTQSAIIHLFLPYFAIELFTLQISIIPLVISIFTFGVFAIVLSALITFIEASKKVTLMLNKVEKRQKQNIFEIFVNKYFANSKFTLKFSLILTATGLKNTMTTVAIIFMSSFLILFGLSIPSIVQTTKDGYYKNLNYSNAYDYTSNVSNAPMSKSTISFSKTPHMIDSDLYKYSTVGNGYLNPTNYNESAFDASPISKYLYYSIGENENKQNDFMNVYKILVRDSANPAIISLFDLLMEQFGNNFANGIGSQFSIGMIDQAIAVIMNSYYDSTNYDTDKYETVSTDLENQVKYEAITKNLQNAIPLILSSIIGGSSNPQADWKEQIISILLSSVPSFVSKYLQDNSRLEQYAFGYNGKKVYFEEETLTTKINASTDEKESVKITGIQSNQKAFNLKNKSVLEISNQTINNIQKVINNHWNGGDIIENEFKYYDSLTKKVSIPIVINNQASNSYNLKKNSKLNNLKTSNQQLKFKTNKGTYDVLPKDAWVYNDTDFIESDYYKNMFKEQTQKEVIKEKRTGLINIKESQFLTPFDLDNNKFTWKNMYQSEANNSYTLKPNSYLFNDFAITEKNDGISYVRPYYQYENLELFLPKSIIFKEGDNFDNWLMKYKGDKENYFEEIKTENVPEQTLNAWKSIYGDKISFEDAGFIKIKPYSLGYSLKDKYDNRGIKNITAYNPDSVWYSKVFREKLFIQETSEVEYLNSDVKVGLNVIDTFESYNTQTVLANQDLINIISNYSTAKKYDISNNLFEKEPFVKRGEVITSKNGVKFTSEFDRYKLHDDNEDLFVEQWWNMLRNGKESIDTSQNMWSNSKYSNLEEPVDLTTGIQQVVQENNGLLLLGQSPLSNISRGDLKTNIEGTKLLSTEKELIKQVTAIAITISLFLIIIVIIVASLLITLMSDIYVATYQRFMILMKSFGYSNWKVQKYSFGTITILALAAWVIATLIGMSALGSLSFIALSFGLAMPSALIWWPIVLSAFIVFTSYFGSLSIVSRKLRKGRPATLLVETHE